MNGARLRARVVVAAAAVAVAGGAVLGVDSVVSHGGLDCTPWTTTHGVGTATADGAAPKITDLQVTRVIDKASPVLFFH